MEQKLVVVVMGQNCERFIEMCLESVKDADAIVYCDGGSNDNTLKIVEDFQYNIQMADKYINNEQLGSYNCVKIINNKYNQEDLGMNGKQRNFYLSYLKQNYPNDWCLVLDADEVVEDLNELKKLIQTYPDGIYSVKMRHLIGDLSHEDSLQETHWVLNRLFKISEVVGYPEVEHPILQGYGTDWMLEKNKIEVDSDKITKLFKTDLTTIWHLAYIPGMWDIKKRYDNHMKKSNIHTPQYLKQWYHSHLFGTYPRKQFNPVELPEVILNKFGINKDELYFANRGIDMKHPLMVKSWYEYFKPDSVLDLGCGRGPYLYFWNWFVNDIKGIDISHFAVDNSFIPNKISQGDVCDETIYKETDLITAIDILEHLDDEQLDKALSNISKYGKKFLFSIPFEGDPNLLLDNTHKQFHTKEWWISKIAGFGIIIEETPTNWLFREQILVGEKLK